MIQYTLNSSSFLTLLIDINSVSFIVRIWTFTLLDMEHFDFTIKSFLYQKSCKVIPKILYTYIFYISSTLWKHVLYQETIKNMIQKQYYNMRILVLEHMANVLI